MPNVTITMDEETARWARIEAAKAGKSVSRFVGDALSERRRAEAEAAWEAARPARQRALAQFLAVEPRDLGLYGRAPSRDEIYNEVLYRHEHSSLRDGPDRPFKDEASEALAQRAGRKGRGRVKRPKPT